MTDSKSNTVWMIFALDRMRASATVAMQAGTQRTQRLAGIVRVNTMWGSGLVYYGLINDRARMCRIRAFLRMVCAV